ncbi:MAG: MATE family efflux transporter [Anaerolineae bacterium]|nr:MATE family efflux transporter [Anaerolineae bacterium]MDW8098384.1 MATE family efflux transporter [Anaerolineae bacterium]
MKLFQRGGLFITHMNWVGVQWLAMRDREISHIVNRLAWPVIAENLLQTLLGVVDMIMVSRLGAAAVAGVGAAGQVIWVINSAFGAVTVGTTVLIAHAIGAGDVSLANRVLKQSAILAAAVAAVLGAIGYLWSDEILFLMGAEPDLVEAGSVYLRIVLEMGIFMIAMFVIGAALRGAGDTQTPMRVTAFINVVNVVVAYGLIFGQWGLPRLGVAGSAWGASIARVVGTAILVVVLLRGKVPISARGRSGWQLDIPLIRRLVRVGVPSMIEQLVLSGGMLLYGIVVIGMGTKIYAAQRITLQIISLSFMPGLGFAMAATTLVGQSLGAKNPERARLAAWRSAFSALLWMSAIGLLAAVLGRPVMRLFSDDREIIEMGTAALAVLALTQPFQAFAQVLAGALRGAGDTRYPMWVTTAGIWLVRLPLAYLFGPVMGMSLAVIYVSNVLDSILRAALNAMRFQRGRWQEIGV